MKRELILSVMVVGLVNMTTAQNAQAATFRVNTERDLVDISIGDGACQTQEGTCSLRAAIQETNATDAFDIIFLPAGHFRLEHQGAADEEQRHEDTAMKGDLDITRDLAIKGQGEAATIIDASGLDRVLHINGWSSFQRRGRPINVYLANLTIQNGNTGNDNDRNQDGGGIYATRHTELAIAAVTLSGNTSMSRGGGLYLEQSHTAKFSHVTIAGNTAQYGGGMFGLSAENVTMRDSQIINNSATRNGGGIYGVFVPVLELNTVTVAGNNAGTDGGGLFIIDDIRLTAARIADNSAEENGGGIFISDNSMVTDEKSTITNNTAAGNGGGIYNLGELSCNHTVVHDNLSRRYGGGLYNHRMGNATLTFITISDNGASAGRVEDLGSGGGIYNEGVMNLQQSLISGNGARWSGGGITNSGLLTLANSTVTNNITSRINSSGGGIYNLPPLAEDEDRPPFKMTLASSTITNNSADRCSGMLHNGLPAELVLNNTIMAENWENTDCCGRIISDGYNVMGRIAHCEMNYRDNNLRRTDNLDLRGGIIDPGLAPLADNGGPTLTHALEQGSPAINRGDPNTCPQTDQRDFPRPAGPRCDIGAFEMQ